MIIEIGRLLRADAMTCVVGCWVNQISTPYFGGLVRIPLDESYQVFGMIYNIKIDDDGLVRQLLSADHVDEDVLQDNRRNRNVPVEISVLFTGYQQGKDFSHLLPPHPPLILDSIYTCTPLEVCQFTEHGHFGYFRHILRAVDLPVGELLAAHMKDASQAHRTTGSPDWSQRAAQELITLLRDDYPTLMNVLGALSDAGVAIGDH